MFPPIEYLEWISGRPKRATDDRVAEAAWERDLLVIPGRFFDASGRFRASLGGAPSAMREALAR